MDGKLEDGLLMMLKTFVGTIFLGGDGLLGVNC